MLKNRLQQRLAPAVRRALAEAEGQRARKKAEEELREAHRNLEQLVAERTAELQRQIDHRMERYSQPPEQYQLGRHTKSLSLDDWLDVMEGGDDGDTPRIPLPMEKKIASKL